MLDDDIAKALKGEKVVSRKGTKGEVGTGWGLRITSIFLGFYGARLDISKNSKIDKILLLNERIYTPEELGTDSPKIQQVNHQKRLTFQAEY